MCLIDEDRLGEADVGELRRGDEVADRVHAGLAGAAVLVDLDEAALVDLDAGAARARARRRTGGGRPTTTTASTSSSLARRRTCTVVPPSPLGVWPVTLTPVRMSMPRFLNAAHDDVGDVVVAAGQDLRQRLEDRHLRAEVGEHRGELAADRAAADDDHARRAAWSSIEHLVAGHDRAVDARSRGSVRGTEPAARTTCVAGELASSPSAAVDRDGVVGAERAGAVEDRDLAAFSSPARPFDEPVDDLLLAGLGRRRSRRSARSASMPNSAACATWRYTRGRLEELLGRDAARG